MTKDAPIRYQIDRLMSDISGLLVTNPDSDLDCSTATSVTGFTLAGTEPPGTARRVAFRMDGTWNRLQSDGMLQALPTQALSAESLLEEGNTVAELEGITNIAAFVGKKIGVAVALHADDPDGAMPTFGLSIKTRTSFAQTKKTELSPLYTLPADSILLKLDAKTTVSEGGTATVEAQIVSPDGTASAWAPLSTHIGAKAASVQFRATLTAPNIGTSSASLERVLVQRSSSGGAGGSVSEIISLTQDWQMPVRQCRMTVQHSKRKRSKQRAFVALRERPVVVAGENVGVGNGESKAFQLAHTAGVKYDSVQVYFDGQRVYQGFEVNTEVGCVSCTAPDGAVVTVDYECGWGTETWSEMSSSGTTPGLDRDSTEYRFVLPHDAQPHSVCAVKIVNESTAGHIEGEPIGTGSGRMRAYPLGGIVNGGKISVLADGVELGVKSWGLADDARSVRVAAAEGAVLTANYDWVSETPVVYQFVAVFSD